MKPRHLVMGLALAGAAALVLFGDRSPSGAISEPVVRARPAAAPAAARAPAPVPTAAAVLPLIPRETLIGDPSAHTPALFGAAAAAPVTQVKNEAPPPPPPPSAPPLPFQVIGKAVSDGQWQVFLARGDRTYVVAANSVIDGVYRVDSIAPPSMTLTYLPLNQQQQLSIGALE
ncbi:hypothetical protein [Massilia sp. TS11]|uniref:hypothetical protein n=1 Tax=Massilia sp. TS11 TaxID=2908003 RepID=UPI001EDBB67B|nr:hypothetical protein [Massilia sp. TS11]MCG2586560.1 hypothetical protein [Massilia sp. TS11]